MEQTKIKSRERKKNVGGETWFLPHFSTRPPQVGKAVQYGIDPDSPGFQTNESVKLTLFFIGRVEENRIVPKLAKSLFTGADIKGRRVKTFFDSSFTFLPFFFSPSPL